MDPNETLRLLRLTIKQMRVDDHPDVRKAHADEVAEYFEALDGWLSAGGFPPEAWREGPDAVGTDSGPDAVAEDRSGPDVPASGVRMLQGDAGKWYVFDGDRPIAGPFARPEGN